MFSLWNKSIDTKLNEYLVEDGLDRMSFGLMQHPDEIVKTQIQWKSKMLVAGMPLVYRLLEEFCRDENCDLPQIKKQFQKLEGTWVNAGDKTVIHLPFSSFIFLERTMLNLVHRLSAIATSTSAFVEIAKPHGIEILDTRKTTPGLRAFERYAVNIGGGKNHRHDFTDSLMIKDNQKTFFGSLKNAWSFYQQNKTFYQTIIVEIHNLEELQEAIALGVQHIMLDNFKIGDIQKAVAMKVAGLTYELSGGVQLHNIRDYMIKGIDAISLSTITFWPSRVDLSWKIQ